jgi:hypothetical protein
VNIMSNLAPRRIQGTASDRWAIGFFVAAFSEG